VNLIFVLLVPEKATDMHLQIISELAQMFSDKSLRDKLLTGSTPAEVHGLIRDWAPHATTQRSAAV